MSSDSLAICSLHTTDLFTPWPELPPSFSYGLREIQHLNTVLDPLLARLFMYLRGLSHSPQPDKALSSSSGLHRTWKKAVDFKFDGQFDYLSLTIRGRRILSWGEREVELDESFHLENSVMTSPILLLLAFFSFFSSLILNALDYC